MLYCYSALYYSRSSLTLNTELISQCLTFKMALSFPQSYRQNPSATALLYIY